MRHFSFMLIGCIGLLCFFSCNSQIESEPTTNLIDFVCNLSLDEDLLSYESRGTLPDNDSETEHPKDRLKYIDYIVYKEGEKDIFHHINYEKGVDSDFGRVSDKLPSGKYHLIFLQYGKEMDFIEESKIQFEGDPGEVFYTRIDIEVRSEPIYLTALLKRVVGRIELKSKDAVPSNAKKVTIKVSDHQSGLNLLSGEGLPNANALMVSHSFQDEEIGQKGLVFGFNTFIPQEEKKLSLLFKCESKNTILRTQSIIDILPIANKILRYTGFLLAPKEGESHWKLKLEEKWEVEEVDLEE